MYLCQFIPICFCASTACYLRPFSSFLSVHLLVHCTQTAGICSPAFLSRGYVCPGPSHRSGGCPWGLALPYPTPDVSSWRSAENGRQFHTNHQPDLTLSCLGVLLETPCFPFTSQASALHGTHQAWVPCADGRHSNTSEGASQSIMWGKNALLRVSPLVCAEPSPPSWCREAFPAACQDFLPHVPTTQSSA